MGYSTPMLEQYNKYNSTHNVSVSDNYIKHLVGSNILSEFKSNDGLKYKFNLRAEKTGKYLSYEYMKKSVKRSLNKEISKKLSASRLRHNVSGVLRPLMIEWENYLNDMVQDDCLIKSEDEIIPVYSLRSN